MRPRNRQTPLVTLLAVLALTLTILPTRTHASDSRPPNILFVYTDDQATWAVGAYGNSDAHTPSIDRIAQEGALFERAFVTTPVCSPARAGLLTGQHSFRTGITDFIQLNREPELSLSPRFVAWPQLLRQRGYRTGLFGKWHLGNRAESHPTRFGYDEFYGFPDRQGGTVSKDPVIEAKGVQQKVSGFTADVITDAAIEFLERNRHQPMLVSLHFREPHTPYGPVAEVDDLVYRSRTLENLPAHPHVDRNWIEERTRAHFKSVASVDRNVGRILDALERMDLAQNTIVIFTSDHGYMIGHNGVYGKGTAAMAGGDIRSSARRPNMFDHGIRVPLLIRWPGVIQPKSRISEMVTNLDFFPTLLDAAGAHGLIPDDYPIPGRNFTPLLRGEKVPWRTAIFGDYDMYHYVENSMRMIRTEEWKLVLHSHPQYQPELYNLLTDPEETTNLAGDPNHFQTMKELRIRLYSWQEWMADPKRRAPWEPL
jgi:uncharacterized sulfatase